MMFGEGNHLRKEPPRIRVACCSKGLLEGKVRLSDRLSEAGRKVGGGIFVMAAGGGLRSQQ